MKPFNVAPGTFDEATFRQVIFPFVDAASGLGIVLARMPEECGWDQSNFFDHDAGSYIYEAALDSLTAHAKHNQLFYNKEKLEDACSQAMVEAFGDAFSKERLKLETAPA